MGGWEARACGTPSALKHSGGDRRAHPPPPPSPPAVIGSATAAAAAASGPPGLRAGSNNPIRLRAGGGDRAESRVSPASSRSMPFGGQREGVRHAGGRFATWRRRRRSRS